MAPRLTPSAYRTAYRGAGRGAGAPGPELVGGAGGAPGPELVGGDAAAPTVLSGLAPLPLADNGSVGYRAASHRGADEDAVLGMRIGGGDRAAGAHRPGLSPVPLPYVRQAVQRAQRRCAEPDAVSLRCHRPRGALALALQTGPAR